MRQRLLSVMVAGLLAIAASGCDEALSDVAGPTQDLEPTFSSIQRYVFDAADSAGRPACTQCHTNVGRPLEAVGPDQCRVRGTSREVQAARDERSAARPVALRAGGPSGRIGLVEDIALDARERWLEIACWSGQVRERFVTSRRGTRTQTGHHHTEEPLTHSCPPLTELLRVDHQRAAHVVVAVAAVLGAQDWESACFGDREFDGHPW